MNDKREFVYTGELFTELGETQFVLPPLESQPIEDSYNELELLGFPLTSPFALVKEIPQNTTLAKDMIQYVGQRVQMIGYYTNPY